MDRIEYIRLIFSSTIWLELIWWDSFLMQIDLKLWQRIWYMWWTHLKIVKTSCLSKVTIDLIKSLQNIKVTVPYFERTFRWSMAKTADNTLETKKFCRSPCNKKRIFLRYTMNPSNKLKTSENTLLECNPSKLNSKAKIKKSRKDEGKYFSEPKNFKETRKFAGLDTRGRITYTVIQYDI